MNNESPSLVTAVCARAAARPGHLPSQVAKFAPLVSTALLMWFAVQILIDAEYIGQNFNLRGFGVFRWIQYILPGHAPLTDHAEPVQSAFPEGADSVHHLAIRQGGVYDCKFLASLISFVRTPSGKNAVLSMVKIGKDGTHTVTFPGTGEATVGPLTTRESIIYAKALDAKGQSHGSWVPVIEKAYGAYRNEHQSWWHKSLRTIKHGVLDGRWTYESELAGFGAAYGAADEEAIRVLTGKETTVMQTATMEIGEFGLGKSYVTLRQLRSWFDRDAVLREFYHEQHMQLIDVMAKNKVAIATTELCGIDKVYGLSSGHAYAVIGYDSVNRLVLIQDPQGPGGDVIDRWSGEARDGVNDGVFEVTLPEFNRFFSHLRVED
jgi:hypothetical protein